MSLEQLGNIRVVSVSRAPEFLSEAPAAIYVITHDAILQSGAVTIPEMLRLAPNLEVVQINATDYAITARGFNVGDNASLSNKLLVLVDGRSVYSPMFGGVYWDMLEIPPEDIERIEVISGPGGTLWGSNAVNGVIDIITRKSAQTQGGLLTLGAGNLEKTLGLQYGGRLGPDLTYRVNGAFDNFNAYPLADGQSAGDGWSRPSGGFRLDWTPPLDAVSVEGNTLAAAEDPDGFVTETDLTGNWKHDLGAGSSFQLMAYVDHAERTVRGGAGFNLNTVDIEGQENARWAWNDIVWGAGERVFSYVFYNTSLALLPPRQTLNLADVFGQDTISLGPQVRLTLGLKLEDEPYAGAQTMPDARLAWNVTDAALLWGAVSRAVRSPTPVDTNLNEYAGSRDILAGSTAFLPEALTAYQLGARMQLPDNSAVSISLYDDVYDHLRTIDQSPAGSASVYQFGNLMSGDVLGLEVWADTRLASWWQVSAGLDELHERLRFLPGSLAAVGLAFVADDPSYQATLDSTINFGAGVTWNAYVRDIGALGHPEVPAYAELDMSLNWAVTDRLKLSLSGFNLLQPEHTEFLENGESMEVPRSVFSQVSVRF